MVIAQLPRAFDVLSHRTDPTQPRPTLSSNPTLLSAPAWERFPFIFSRTHLFPRWTATLLFLRPFLPESNKVESMLWSHPWPALTLLALLSSCLHCSHPACIYIRIKPAPFVPSYCTGKLSSIRKICVLANSSERFILLPLCHNHIHIYTHIHIYQCKTKSNSSKKQSKNAEELPRKTWQFIVCRQQCPLQVFTGRHALWQYLHFTNATMVFWQ